MTGIKIAITGKMRSGKDTLREYAESKYNMTPFTFGETLKKSFHKEYPHIPVKPKPHRGYQLYGQLKREVYGDDYWIIKCMESIDACEKIAQGYSVSPNYLPSKYDLLVDQENFKESVFSPIISDLRQQNELDYCLYRGFHVVKVECPDNIRIERIKQSDEFNSDALNFETERSVDSLKGIDFCIDNSTTVKNMYSQFDEIIERITTKIN